MSRRIGILLVVTAVILIAAGTVVHVFPPHLTIVTVLLGLPGALIYVAGIACTADLVRQYHRAGAYVMIVAAFVTAGPLMGVAPTAGTTIARAALGETQVCTVTEVDAVAGRRGSRTYVHAVRCPDGRVHEIKTGREGQHVMGAPAEVVADAGGLLTPGFTAGAYQWAGVGFCSVLLLVVSALPFLAWRFSKSGQRR